ncbi:MAG: acyl-CoA dehydrogenase family protein [Longimicrobiales bacterium]
MSNAANVPDTAPRTDAPDLVRDELGPRFAERAAAHDRDGAFVDANWADLREHELFWMAIPRELGGGGAPYAAVCDTIRALGRACGSTALAYSMHTHPVATNVFKHRRGDAGATRALEKIAGKRLVIAGTGANDWLSSSGEAVPVDGGWRVNAHKRFVSGAPGAQLFVTSAGADAAEGRQVLHFAVPFATEGVRIVETWDALGMRGTGSHDVMLEDVFVPEEAVVVRRPAGVWHPMWDVVLPTALPLITAAYVGIAETAAELGRTAARKSGAAAASQVGAMDNALVTARLALDDMVRRNDDHGFAPSQEGTQAILARKAIATTAVEQTVALAADLAGGKGFFRGHPLERMVRDVRAMHFHPLPVHSQETFCGRGALGLDPVEAD